jgi:hypothetical protein
VQFLSRRPNKSRFKEEEEKKKADEMLDGFIEKIFSSIFKPN